MNNFIYETPTKVYFGKDEELKVGKIIAEFHPKKVLVHFGGNSARKSGLLDKVENCLREENISFVELGGVVANPELYPCSWWRFCSGFFKGNCEWTGKPGSRCLGFPLW